MYTMMNEEQIESLRDILTREQEEITKIYEKYQTEENTELETETGDSIY